MAWVVQVAEADAIGLAALLGRNVVVQPEAAVVWAKGIDDDAATESLLRALPILGRWEALSDGRLLAVGRRVPSAKSPAGTWTPLEGWLRVAQQSAALPGRLEGRSALRLERGAAPIDRGLCLEPAALLTDAKNWRTYAETAASVRLNRLWFAADRTGRVLVFGDPLPPLPGERLLGADGIFWPCGHHWRPAVDPATVRVMLGLVEHQRAILNRDGSFESIVENEVVPAGRAAVRLTMEAADE